VARDYFPVSLAARLGRSAGSTKFVLTRHVLFPMKTLHRFALANVSRVIAVSKAVADQLTEERVFAPEKIVHIANGIDISHWRDAPHEYLRTGFRSSHGIPHDAPLVGTVGELKKLKGQEDLLLAAEMILQRFPETYFVIAGADNTAGNSAGGYLKHLQSLATVIGAEDRFIWIDRVDDTGPLLHASDVFVSASHSESFGLAILEAMASGCAVVSTATEGAKELLGEKGLVPIGDPLELANAVSLFLSDEDKRKESGQIDQEIAQKNFALEKMIEATERLYQGLF
jgi:glycosyltransferase involved in cell wall biosynthesis